MKKYIILFISILLLSGCNDLNNTPTRQVEMFFNKYQTIDKEVLDDLNSVVNEEEKFDSEDRERYREIIKKNYQKLSYKIKDEKIDGNNAIVTVEIEVVDYSKVINDSDNYLKEHQDEFLTDNEYDEKKFTKYKLDKLDEAKETVKYTLELGLTKEDKTWTLNDLDSTQIDKINGMYMY